MQRLFVEADQALAAARAANAECSRPGLSHAARRRMPTPRPTSRAAATSERIRAAIAAATVVFKEASDAAEIANVTLASLVKTRADANNANAATFAAELWTEASRSASIPPRGGSRRATSAARAAARTRRRRCIATPSSRRSRRSISSQTRALLAEADQARVARVAPKTYEKARALLEQAERELSENRYDTDLPRSLAQQANYEARHAIYLAKLLSAMRDEDRSLEDIILSYEEPLVQVGAAADKVVQLDQGVDPVVDGARRLHRRAARAGRASPRVDLTDSRARIGELEEEIRDLDEQLGGVSQERVALVQRLEAEARIREQFATVENLFQRDEARVSREGNRMIIRLVGLTFPSGGSDVTGRRIGALLEKVQQAADVFPRSQVVIEGHTDSYGSDDANLALSRRRAEAISAYLTGSLGVQAFRISAVGYGETQPIANNDTAQGRERNRRIDVIIEPQLESAPSP